MSTTPRNFSRFLPTLTEVVSPSGLARTSVPATPDIAEIVQSVMQRVDGVIERRLREEADAIALTLVTEQAEQLQALRLRLRQEMEIVVRQVMAEVLSSRADSPK